MRLKTMPGIKPSISLLLLGSALLLSACASTNLSNKNASKNGPDLSEVKQNPVVFVGEQIRWGGSIVSIRNEQDKSIVELVQRPLYQSGRPRTVDSTSGRFMAEIDSFLDPEVYAKGRLLTVEGAITGEEQGSIGDQNYVFPVISAIDSKLWPKTVNTRYPYRYPSSYWNDPYGFGFRHGFPYHHHHHDNRPRPRPSKLKSPIYR